MSSVQSSVADKPRDSHFVNHDFPQVLLESVARLQRSQKLTDVTLMADGVLLPCHRLILAAASPYFNAMFTSGFQESASPTVEIKSTDLQTLRCIIDYLYSGDITITSDNVQNLAQLSSEFQLDSLSKACEKYMLRQLEADNSIGFYKFATLFSLKKLQTEARHLMLAYFQSLVDTVEFKELSEAELVEYISDSSLRVRNEDTVFGAVTLWVNSDVAGRRAAFERVLAHVRVPFCTSTYLSQVVDNEPLMSAPLCKKYLQEARMFQTAPQSGPAETGSQRTVPRKRFSLEPRLLILGCGREETERFWQFSDEDKTLNELTTLPQLQHRAPFFGDSLENCLDNTEMYSVCSTDRGLVLTGGVMTCQDEERYVTTDKCWLFDVIFQKWIAMPRMKEARTGHTSVAHRGLVYVIGGRYCDPVDELDHDNYWHIDSVECFDPRKQVWEELTTPTPCRWNYREGPRPVYIPLVTAALGDCIYVFGADQTTHQYDVTRREWSTKAIMPRGALMSAAVVTINDCIFTLAITDHGGMQFMSYDPALDTWTVLEPPSDSANLMLHNMPRVSAVAWKGELLAVMDRRDRPAWSVPTLRVGHIYDPEAGNWSTRDLGKEFRAVLGLSCLLC